MFGAKMEINTWIHCNKCGVHYGPNVEIFIMECAHLLCGICLYKNRETVNKCLICNMKVNYIKVTSSMDPKIKDFFVPLEQHMKRLTEICTFQQQHADIWTNKMTAKYQHAHDCINKMTAKYQECKEHIEKLASENQDLKAYIRSHRGGKGASSRKMPTSTPAMPYRVPFITPGHSIISSIQRGPRDTSRHPAMPRTGMSQPHLNEPSNRGPSFWARRVTLVPDMLQGAPPPNYPLGATRFAPSTMMPLNQLQRSSSGLSSSVQSRQ